MIIEILRIYDESQGTSKYRNFLLIGKKVSVTSVQEIVSRDRETNRTDLIENKCVKPILINYGFRKTKCVQNLCKIHFLAINFNIFY